MFTVKIMFKDGRVSLYSYKDFHFVGPDSDQYQQFIDINYDDDDNNEKDFPWGYVYDSSDCECFEWLHFGDQLYVTDGTGKTVLSLSAYLPPKANEEKDEQEDL